MSRRQVSLDWPASSPPDSPATSLIGGTDGALRFFSPADRDVTLARRKEESERRGLELWTYCLISNHIHLIVCRAEPDSQSRAVGKAHADYARWVNRTKFLPSRLLTTSRSSFEDEDREAYLAHGERCGRLLN